MPFHDIFKKAGKKIRNMKKSPKTPLIVADIHEKNSLILSELHGSRQIRLDIRQLKIADYLIGDIAIERKTVSDLISSMINKRLVHQLNQMKRYRKQILIIEGELDSVLEENNNIAKAVRGLILSILTNYQIPIIFTKDAEDSAKYLITLARQKVKPKAFPSLHSRIPKELKQQKQYILESFPDIGAKKAELLLKKFKTLEKIFNASGDELKDILKSKTENFRKILDN